MARPISPERVEKMLAAHAANPRDPGPAIGAIAHKANATSIMIGTVLGLPQPSVIRWITGSVKPQNAQMLKLQEALAFFVWCKDAGRFPLTGSSAERLDQLKGHYRDFNRAKRAAE